MSFTSQVMHQQWRCLAMGQNLLDHPCCTWHFVVKHTPESWNILIPMLLVYRESQLSGVISPLIWVISIVTLLITLLITTHEPPSSHPVHCTSWG